MTSTIFISLLSYIFIMSYTPGPANILSINISANYGFRPFLRVLTGLFTGFLCDMICCAIFSYGFNTLLPQITSVLTYMGAIYLVWLAIHIFRSKPTHVETNKENPSFLLGFFLQLSNVKIILYGLSVFSTFVTPYFHTLPYITGFILLLPIVGASSCIVWALFGQMLTNFFHKYYRACNSIMALALLWCTYEVLFAK